MGTYPVWYRLPTAYCTEIGRIVTRFAVIEAILRQCSYALLGISPKQGRIAVRLGRVEDTITAISDLMTLSGVTSNVEMSVLLTELKDLESWRDKLSHGIWVKHRASKEPILQVTSGNYQPSGAHMKTKARISPRAAHVPIETLRSFASRLSHAKPVVEKLRRDIVSGLRKASRRKSRSR